MHQFQLCELVGRDKLVFDLSCRRKQDQEGWFVGKSRQEKWRSLLLVLVLVQVLVLSQTAAP